MSSAVASPEISRMPLPKWPVLKPVGSDDRPAVRLNRATCVVGDRSVVHLPLPSAMVSRSHALIVLDQSEVYIRDLASRNRVFVNGSPVRETALRAADLLQIGPYRFRCYAGFAQRPDGHLAAGARLKPADGPHDHALDGRTFVIGRRLECDLPIDSPAVSRVHAVIFRRSGRHFVRDLNSKAGTLVNGQRIREAELKDGDELTILGTTLRYQLSPESENEPEALEPISSGPESSAAASGELSASAGALSATTGALSGTIGSQSAGGATMLDPQQHATEPPPPPEPVPELGPATADDFGFDSNVSLAPANVIEPSDGGLITAAELFAPEISLPGRAVIEGFGPAPSDN